MKIFFIGEIPKKSAPSLTIGEYLKQLGYNVQYVSLCDYNVSTIFKIFSKKNVVIYINYGEESIYFYNRLAVVCLSRVMLFRWWVGTDVFNVLNNVTIQNKAKCIDRIIDKNLAVSSHLVQELETVKILSSELPIYSYKKDVFVHPWTFSRSRNILIYLPTQRENFYGISTVLDVINDNSDCTFHILMNSGKYFLNYENVICYDWVEDMEYMYSICGILIRVTMHDGLPRMIIDALFRGLYVLYSFELPGCVHVRSVSDINCALTTIKKINSINFDGINKSKIAFSAIKFEREVKKLFDSKFSNINLNKILFVLKTICNYGLIKLKNLFNFNRS